MPCNCIVDKPSYPQNEEWGPIFWSVFHSLAERAGKQTNDIMRADEMRAWPLFVKKCVPCIPCPYCRDHAATYLLQNPFVLPESYNEWSVYIKTWWWTFHEAVNLSLGKPSFPFDQLTYTYRDVSRFTFWFRQIEAYELRAAKMDGIRLLDWIAWKKELVLLRGTFGM
jgi:hypothetical protein